MLQTVKSSLDISYLEKHEDIINFYANNIKLRDVNYKQFNNSLLHCNNFFKLIQLIKDTTYLKKQLVDNMIQEKNHCLNEFASITISTNKYQQKIQLELIILEKILYNHYNNVIEMFNNDDLNIYTYPKEFFNFDQYTLSGNLNKTAEYSEHYTLYI